MKIAVFSDVHGNLKALKAVLEQIKEENVDLTVFLGDIFQRGNEEIECLELLKDNEIICLKGNCELYMEYGVDIDPDVEYLRGYYDETRKKLTDEHMLFIKQMPLFYECVCHGHKIHFSHFLFSDINAPYPFLQLADLKNGVFDKVCKSEDVLKYDLVAIGHSHKNFVKGNVVSVSASGLEGATYLLIEDNGDSVSVKHISIDGLTN
ncbi:MAG: metallophosphoesterase family protein [Lachnospiraceae bacterium]|nr:metallophosphoesterase family protein [Lachnospiraceae bacterium]